MPVGQPKTGGSWWRDLTECGPLEKGMANHFSILALRTPWTVWKGHILLKLPLESLVGLHAAKSLQSCPTPRDPMDCSLPGSSVHGIFQARVLEWGAIVFSTKTGRRTLIQNPHALCSKTMWWPASISHRIIFHSLNILVNVLPFLYSIDVLYTVNIFTS